MKIYDIPLKRLILRLKRTARKMLGRKDRIGRRGRHGTPLHIRITVTAYMVLAGLSLIRMEQSLRESPELRKLLGLKRPVSKTTLSRWRKNLGPLIRELIEYTYRLIARLKGVSKSIAIIDTTGFKRSRASSHYEDRIGRKKKMYAKVIAAYSPDVDAVFTVGVDYDTMHDVRMAEGILDRIANSGLFDRLVGDKGFDSSELMMRAAKRHLVPCIDVRGGKLRPRSGIRLLSKRNYDALRAERGNIRSLVESLFCSVKALGYGFVRSPLLEGFASEIAVMFLAYNIAVLVRLEQRSSKV